MSRELFKCDQVTSPITGKIIKPFGTTNKTATVWSCSFLFDNHHRYFPPANANYSGNTLCQSENLSPNVHDSSETLIKITSVFSYTHTGSLFDVLH